MAAPNKHDSVKASQRRTLRRWLKSTSNRTFVLYPLCIAALEAALQRGWPSVAAWGLPLLLWGCLQYRWVGRYRTRLGGGGPGLAVPPDRIVDRGPYALVRNPMYLGHLIFMAGLALTFRSLAALALLAVHVVWFQRRVLQDEAHLQARFGADYADYRWRVKRWIPGLF
jgi:protein-S-isoprenylcysteine O-methyltransferase Ste14